MVTERASDKARLHGKGVFGNTELEILVPISALDPTTSVFFTKLNCSFVLVRGFGLAIGADRDTLIFTAH
jgi:hypothetical protein